MLDANMEMVFVLSEDFVKVADIKDIQRSQMKAVEVDGESICIVNIEGKYFAIGSVCTHEGGPLADGTLEGYEVECPWHGSKFDVRTGEVTNPPADTPEPVYEVKVEGNNILVKKRITSIEQQQQDQKQPATSSLYHLTLLEKQKFEGTDIMSFRFSKQNEQQEGDQGNGKSSLDYKAGQYAFFDIGGVNNDPKGPIRHFTISSSPTEDFIMLSTRIRDTPYKKRLSSLEERAQVKVRGPQGNFVLHEDYSKPAIFLSGGIGVTPFRSMIKYATDRQLPIKIIMFDSNRDEKNILFKNEFDAFTNSNKNLRIIYTISEEEGGQVREQISSSKWEGERGRIDEAMLNKYLSEDDIKNSIFYTCGPPGMLKAMQKLLQDELHIPNGRIMIEEFTGY
jgi:ferredoxin-NADP reductase/nitrite reductase/ring-hydroxylating ferredoxin subunit